MSPSMGGSSPWIVAMGASSGDGSLPRAEISSRCCPMETSCWCAPMDTCGPCAPRMGYVYGANRSRVKARESRSWPARDPRSSPRTSVHRYRRSQLRKHSDSNRRRPPLRPPPESRHKAPPAPRSDRRLGKNKTPNLASGVRRDFRNHRGITGNGDPVEQFSRPAHQRILSGKNSRIRSS